MTSENDTVAHNLCMSMKTAHKDVQNVFARLLWRSQDAFLRRAKRGRGEKHRLFLHCSRVCCCSTNNNNNTKRKKTTTPPPPPPPPKQRDTKRMAFNFDCQPRTACGIPFMQADRTMARVAAKCPTVVAPRRVRPMPVGKRNQEGSIGRSKYICALSRRLHSFTKMLMRMQSETSCVREPMLAHWRRARAEPLAVR